LFAIQLKVEQSSEKSSAPVEASTRSLISSAHSPCHSLKTKKKIIVGNVSKYDVVAAC